MTELFSRKRVPGRVAEIKRWVGVRLGLADGDLVTLVELQCHEQGCPPVETVITVLPEAGGRFVSRIHKPLVEITETDIAAACPPRG